MLWFFHCDCCYDDDPTVHGGGSLYTACRDWFFTISSFNHFCLGVGVLPDHPLVCHLPPPLICAGNATSHYQTKSSILFACSPWHSYPDKGGHSLSLSLMACTYWFQLIILSFGWYVIPAGHFTQKSLSGNPRIGSPLLPTARPYPLLPLTHGPPLLYWLVTNWWCLSLMCASLPCVSMACLLFMHLP